MYNLSGKRLETLARGNDLPGTHRLHVKSTEYVSGIYFLKLVTGKHAEVQKVIIYQ